MAFSDQGKARDDILFENKRLNLVFMSNKIVTMGHRVNKNKRKIFSLTQLYHYTILTMWNL